MFFQRKYGSSLFTFQDYQFYTQQPIDSLSGLKKIAILLDGAIEIPPTCGLIYRLFHLTIALKQQGLDVVWIIRNRNFLSIGDFERLANHGIRMHILPAEKFCDTQYVKKIIQEEQVDLVQFEVTQDFLYFVCVLKNELKIPVVLEVHESDYLLRNSINGSQLHLIDFIQRAAIYASDAVICMTQSELAYLSDASSKKFFLAPNGVATSFPKLRKKSPDPVILFLGNLFYFPNQQAVVYLIEEIFPLVKERIPNARLKIIGMLPDILKMRYARCSDIEFTGEIKDEEQFYSALAEGSLGICPLLSGAGMKVKILNYAAGGFPIVSTPFGAMGYEQLRGLAICDMSPTEIAQKAIAFLSSESLAHMHGEQLRESVIEHYCWGAVVKEVMAAYRFAHQAVHAEKTPVQEIPPSLFFEENRHAEQTFSQHIVIEPGVSVFT